MFEYQVIILWLAVTSYAGAYLCLTIINLWQHPSLKILSKFFGVLGFAFHTVALGLRWFESGHGPYHNFYEVLVSDAWVALLLFIVLVYRLPDLRKVAFIIYPLVMVTIAYAVFQAPEQKDLPPSYATFWLVIHVIFAKLSYGSCLLSAAAGVLYLREKKAIYETWQYRMAGLGFLNLGIMIASGSVWAYRAWGRFWGWDPIETWALISWLVYALYLHLWRTRNWRGKRAAWLSIFCFILVVISFFCLKFLYPSVHENLTL